MKTYFDWLISQGEDPVKANRFEREMASLVTCVREIAFGDGRVPSPIGRFSLYLLYCGIHAYLDDAGFPVPKQLLEDKKKAADRLPKRELQARGFPLELLSHYSKPDAMRNRANLYRPLVRAAKNDIDIPIEEVNLFTLAARMNNKDVADSTVVKTERLLWEIDSDLATKVVGYLHGSDKPDKPAASRQKASDIYSAIRAVVKKLGGKGMTLTKEQADKARMKAGTAAIYKEYNALRNQSKKMFTTAFMLMVNANNNLPFDVAVAEKKMRDKGFELMWLPTSSTGFKGKVGVHDGKIAFYTTAGKLLSAAIAPGSKVIMNPKYDAETDNTYYMIVQAPNGISEGARSYTAEYKRGSTKAKFAKADDVTRRLPEFIKRWQRDMKSEDIRTKMCGTLAMCQYLTGARVGSRTKRIASKKGIATFGILSLKVGHVSVTGRNIILTYVGKKAQAQKHIIKLDNATVKLMAKIFKELMAGKGKEERLFVMPSTVGSKIIEINWGIYDRYLKSMGFTQGSHKLRHARGTALVEKLLTEKPWKPTAKEKTLTQRQKSADDYMKNNVLSKVAALLGHKAAGGTKLAWRTSINAYVKPDVVVDWYNNNQLRVPSWVPSKVAD